MIFIEKLPQYKTFSLLLTAILTSHLMSCVEFRNNKKKEEEPPAPVASADTPPVPGANTDSQDSKIQDADPNSDSMKVTFDLRESSIPHQYQLMIKWPKVWTKIVVEDKGVVIFETDSAQSYTHAFKDNIDIFVRVFSYDDERPILIDEYKGRTPKDFTFSSLELKENFSVAANRIYLPTGVRIQTNNFDFDVRALSLFSSDDAEVFSFPPGLKAESLQNGRSGGTVSIRSPRAQGRIKIRMTGENGGNGTNGAPHARAASGAAGGDGAHECYQPCPYCPTVCRCTRQPGNGHPGAQGLIGNPGLRAGAGGDTGSIFVQITEASAFTAEASLVAGNAGVPGQGSEGQLGGFGGPGGNPTSSSCGGSYAGAEGAHGGKGSDAPPSADGAIGTQCVSIAQDSLDCRKR
ncbi:MAG: hypothetical protein IPK04_10405 [Bdellovibrionales bacterium]|nr:hypothetical protein [Bdellovibrionales bacterium]